MLGTRGVVYERGLAPLLRDALAELGGGIDVLVELDDGSDAPSIPGAVDFETIVAAGGHVEDDTSPDDIYIACTGGTTGRPKAVLWRQGDLYVAAIGGSDDADEATIRARAEAGAGVWFPTSPLMHVAAQWTVFLAASMGATVVLHDDRKRFDAPTILATAARERANMMTIIGDAYARPLDRGAPTHALRPLGARRARHRRDAHQRGRQGRALGAPAERHHPRRLRRVGDRGDGLGRPERARRPDPALPGHPLGAHPRRRPNPLPLAGRDRGRLDRAHRARPARLSRRRGRDQRDVPRRRRRSGSRSPATARSTPTTARSCCSAATLSW